MDITSPEKGKQKPEVIHLNQEFALFDPRFTKAMSPDHEASYYRSNIIFQTGTLPDLSFEIEARLPADSLYKKDVISPFNPSLGYQITEDDLDAEKRKEKLKRLFGSLTRGVNFSEPYLWVYGLDKSKKILPEHGKILNRLRFQVSFPNSDFEGYIYYDSLYYPDDFHIFFTGYHPLDTGPLPRAYYEGEQLFEHFELLLPRDFKRLQQIRGKFVLAPQQTPNPKS